MIDNETIIARLEKLQEYAGYLQEYQKITLKQFKRDHTLQGAVFHYLQLSIECTIDVGEILISGLRLRKPNQASEVIEILAENKIIPKDFASKFYPAIGLRNILVHDYLKIDLDKVYTHLKEDLQDLNFFAKCVAKYIKDKSKMD